MKAQVGNLVRLQDRWFRVVRINHCGMTLKPTSVNAKEVTIGDKTFMAHEGGSTLVVSANAFFDEVRAE